MKIRQTITVIAAAFSCSLFAAENLVRNSDFENGPKNLSPEYRVRSGKLSLFTEDRTWNKCAKLEYSGITKGKKYNSISAQVWIGCSGKTCGFPCKPETVYQFSFDLKGTAQTFSVHGYEWKKGASPGKGKKIKSSVERTPVKPEWTTVKGTFKTGPKAEKAVLVLSLWEYDLHAPLKGKPGDYVLFDNVRITEKAIPAALLKPAEGIKAVPVRKTASASACTLDDFQLHPSGTQDNKTIVSLQLSGKELHLHVECREPGKITTAPVFWKNDTFEIFLAGKDFFRQFVFTPDGKTYTGNGAGVISVPWKIKTEQKEQVWSGDAVIPLSSLSGKLKEGDILSFNMARTRQCVNESVIWSPVKDNFHDRNRYGRLVLGSYPEKMTRDQYEKFIQRKETGELWKRAEKSVSRKILVSQMGVTDDFSLPLQPDSLFEVQKELRADLAVNEMRGIPVAIFNNTNQTEEYRVTVDLPVKKAPAWQDGDDLPWITLRQAARIRDNDQGGSAIYDPLPKLNESGILLIPAREAVLLWIDVNTEDLAPQTVNARLRIVPLCGRGEFSKNKKTNSFTYKGDMTDIPLILNIRNIVLAKEPAVPADFFNAVPDPETAVCLKQLGAGFAQLSPWSLAFPQRPDGSFSPEVPEKTQAYLNQVKKYGFTRLFVGYSVYKWVSRQQKCYKDPDWGKWVKTLQDFLKNNGFDLTESYMEIWDEPKENMYPELLEVCRKAKEAAPEMRTGLTLGSAQMSLDTMKKFHPYVDHWILYSNAYFGKKEYLEFYRQAQKEGKTFSHYTCFVTVRTSLARNFRRNPWFGECHHLDGNNMYQMFTAWGDHCTWKGKQGWSLLYKDVRHAVPSIRYMAVRQGMNDVKYLAKLREAGKNSAEAQKFLQTAAERVVLDHPHDSSMPDKVREEAAQLILKLTHTPPK